MIFFKKSKIVVDCFTTNNAVAELFPIRPLIESMPDWWKSAPKTIPAGNFFAEVGTIKKCPGFVDLFKNNLCIPAWSEYRLFQDPTHGISHVVPNSFAQGSFHYQEQMVGAFPGYQHYKLVNPWVIKEKSGIKFIMAHPSWHDPSPCDYHVLTGSLEFKYQHSLHINLIAPKQETLKQFTIPAGRPLAYLIPKTDKKVEVNIEVVSEAEYNKLRTYHHSFSNSYQITKKILKERA